MTIEDIFANLTEYRDNIDDLVRSLRLLGVNSFDEFMSLANEYGEPVPRGIRVALEGKFTSMEDDDWASARAAHTIEAYQNYLNAYPDGQFRAQARDEMDSLRRNNMVEDAWNAVDKSSVSAIQDFMASYPNSRYQTEARNLLKNLGASGLCDGESIRLLQDKIKDISRNDNILNKEQYIYDYIIGELSANILSVDDILELIKQDSNILNSHIVRQLLNNNIITNIQSTGIGNDVIDMVKNAMPLPPLPPVPPPNAISKTPCTEIYFWGIPASGKSCALGAILSTANSGRIATSMQADSNCQGYGYLYRLSNLFNLNKVGMFPPGNAVGATYEMGFDIEDNKSRIHPIICVDLAGELIGAMYKTNAREPLRDNERDALATLTKMLVDHRTRNRKMHFFVLEYGAEDRVYNGLPQHVHLAAAAEYIKKTGVFDKDTDAIYLLITKVDRAKAVGAELQQKLRDHIVDNYQGFYKTLKLICRTNEINDGEVEILPFSVGDVYFQNYCRFKEDTASNVVKIILDKSYSYKPGKLKRLIDKLRK